MSRRMQPDSQTLTLRDYVAPVARRWLLVLAIVIVVTGAVSAYYATRHATYTTSTKVFLGPTAAGSSGVGVFEPSTETAADQAVLLTSTETAAKVAARIGYRGSAAALAGSVVARAASDTNFLDITVTEASSAQAARVANAFAQQFINETSATTQAAANQQLGTLRQQLAKAKSPADSAERLTIQSQIQQLQVQVSSALGGTTQVDVATGGSAHRDSPIKFGLLAAVGSLIGAILLTFGLERLDPRVKNAHDAAVVYQHPVLAAIIRDPDVEAFVDGKPALSSRTRESFRQLRVLLELAAPVGKPFKTIVITSAVQGEGKSTVARNLALALAESGRRTLLIDADLRRPRLVKALGLEPGSGLSHVLAAEQSVADVIVDVEAKMAEQLGDPVQATSDGPLQPGFQETTQFSFISAGGQVPNPPAALESKSFTEMLDLVSETYDVILIDTAPVVAVPDALPLIRVADAVVMVTRDSTDSRSASRAAQLVSAIPGANVVGLVINDVAASQAAAYGTGYGYSYGATDATKSR